jgi:hypothetical protein
MVNPYLPAKITGRKGRYKRAMSALAAGALASPISPAAKAVPTAAPRASVIRQWSIKDSNLAL